MGGVLKDNIHASFIALTSDNVTAGGDGFSLCGMGLAAMRDEGMSVREVAAALGVNKETVVHDGQVYGNRTGPEPTAEDPEPEPDDRSVPNGTPGALET